MDRVFKPREAEPLPARALPIPLVTKGLSRSEDEK
jgi:hypothetical protein